MAKIYQGNAIIAEENTVLSGHPATESYDGYVSDLNKKTGSLDDLATKCELNNETREERIERLTDVISENIKDEE